MFIIKIERDKTRANFASASAGTQIEVQRQGDSPPATKLRPSKNPAGTRFLRRQGRLIISRRKITRLFPGPCKVIQFRSGDKLIAVSSAARSCARHTRCAENRTLSGPTTPPPAPLRCAGTSDDRPDLPANDWTAPPTTEPVAAAAIGSAVGSFTGADAAMRGHRIIRQKGREN